MVTEKEWNEMMVKIKEIFKEQRSIMDIFAGTNTDSFVMNLSRYEENYLFTVLNGIGSGMMDLNDLDWAKLQEYKKKVLGRE